LKRSLSLVTLLALGGLAWAGDWASMKAVFPAFPCSDGWAGCMVGDRYVSSGPVVDAAGRPHPADMRFGFFEFDSLPGSSPFTGLSVYTADALADAGPAPEAAPAPAPSEEPAQEEDGQAEAAPPVPVPSGEDDYGSDSRTGAAPVPVPRVQEPEPASTGREPAPREDASRTPAPAPTPPPAPAPTPPPAPAPTPPPAPAPTPPPAPPPPPVPAPQPPPPPVVAEAPRPVPAPAPAAPADNSCDDLVSLEAPAMLGQLGDGRRKCLETRLAGAAQQTDKKKISLVLIQDARAAGDQKRWESLTKRHLEDIDRSDPDMCMAYAIQLAKGGVGRASGVIRWADYALENKQKWTGANYSKNVYNLYKLRATAANKLWESAEAKFNEERNEANEQAAARYRGMTKDYAREWLDYARASQGSTTQPLALCVSAAGSKEFCEG
jgi:hypothetical protein